MPLLCLGVPKVKFSINRPFSCPNTTFISTSHKTETVNLYGVVFYSQCHKNSRVIASINQFYGNGFVVSAQISEPRDDSPREAAISLLKKVGVVACH